MKDIYAGIEVSSIIIVVVAIISLVFMGIIIWVTIK